MLPVPDNQKELLSFANDTIETCRVSVGMRSAYYRLLNSIAETGRYDGTKALVNLLNKHLDRTASHLFSPIDLKFTVSTLHPQLPNVQQQLRVTGDALTQCWENDSTDTTFARGVFDALKYGGVLLKQWVEMEGEEEIPDYFAKLVMPWQFGVYREDENRIDRQEALCETVSLTLPEVWRRIWLLPDAEKLFDKIKSHSKKGEATSDPQSFFHQVLSTSQINTGVQGMTKPLPGGIVQLNNDPNYSIMGPVIAVDMVQMHELWVKGATDYTTIQVIEPDLLIAPLHKRANLLVKDSKLQPYRLIQPNEVSNWFWGRSELVDMIEPQGLLSQFCADFKRLVGVQIDKFLGFSGENGMTDELYAQARMAGFINMGQGASVEDLTPKLPSELLPAIQWLIQQINELGGFPPIMEGKGESGIRAGVHADTAKKMASPTLRDRALLVERQCAQCADLTLEIKKAKDSSNYWTKAEKIQDVNDTLFLLSQLPDDTRVTVDSHSSSPIFQDEHTQLVFAAHAKGVVGEEYVIENTPLPNKEAAKTELKEKKKAAQEQLEKLTKQFPDLGQKLAEKEVVGGKKK